MLEIRNVHQAFRSGFMMKQVEILKDISFVIPSKSIFGFLGPNGAGKTTLIHLIVGLKKPISGSLKLNGQDCHTKEARAKIGYLPERPYFYDHLTAEGILHYFGALSGMSRRQVDAKVDDVLRSVGMLHAKRLELKKYSKGMLQRVGIAQAMIHDPDFLVLDEPMSGLDPVGRKEMRELILKLAQQGQTIFFSSHVIPDVEAICDQVAIIRKGTLMECGPVSKFVAKEAVGTEVAFTGISLDTAKQIVGLEALREIPEGFRAMIPANVSVNHSVSDLMAKKAQIISVSPVRPSLEDIFS